MTLAPPVAADSTVPTPTTRRWQPLRLGLIDLFHYENEEFPFRDGRLLLRGNNGAGKSKVLALTMPFLLDGDTSARRVEPDADTGKRMEWNLLLGGEHPNSERLGYSWLEFGRVDDDGEYHYFTIGAGLKAARGRGITKNWFFTTSRRLGVDLSLVDGSRVALGRDRLAAELGESGRVFDTKRDYRRAVDEQLFRLGDSRYDALVDLLIQIRAPQLSKRPNERLLSDALTESLTPVGRELIESVAEGLRGLDEEREQLQQLSEVHRSVLAFLQHYRAYARVLVRRQADGPRQTQAEFDRIGREIIELTQQQTDAVAQVAAASAELDALHVEQRERTGEREALRDSEFVQIEAQLRAADDAAASAAARSRRAATASDDSARRVAESTREVEEAGALAESARRRLEGSLEAATTAARAVGIETQHGALAAGPADPAAVEADRVATRERFDAALEAVARVAQLIEAVALADAAVQGTQRVLDERESRVADTIADRTAADDRVSDAVERYLTEVEQVVASLSELTVSDAEFESFAEWVTARDGDDPLVSALQTAAAELTSTLARSRATVEARRDGLGTRLDDLDAEIAALVGGESAAPPPVHTRIQPSDSEVALWRAVSFRDDVDDNARAGLEAALEASGLLTAVISSDAEVTDPGSGELILRAGGSPSGPTLSTALRAELPAGSTLGTAQVDAVLASISLVDESRVPQSPAVEAGADGPLPGGTGEGAAFWVSTSGRYRIGQAYGAWSKPAAAYVGESARADARRRRLDEARIERDSVSAGIREADDELAAIERRVTVIADEQRAIPHPTVVDARTREAALAAAIATSAERDRDTARESVDVAATVRREREDELAADAAILTLPTDAAAITERRSALLVYQDATRDFWPAVESLWRERSALESAEDRLRDRRGSGERDSAELRDAADDDVQKRSYAQSLRSTVGDDVARYRERVAEAAAALERIEKDLESTRTSRETASRREAVLDEKLRSTRERQDVVAEQRVASVSALRRTTALGLLRVALPDLDAPDPDADWSVTQGVQLARLVEPVLAEVDSSDQRFERLLASAHTEFSTLQRGLGRHGHEAVSEPRDDGYRVVVVFRGRQTSLVDLGEGIRDDIEQRERLLGAREREIIENHLVTEIGTHLSELVGAADAQIADVNAELDSRPTSTGMKLRVRWRQRADGPPGLAEARARLSTLADAWDEADRAALGLFLQERIAEVRDSDESGNWYDSLGDALDYRRWHHFVVERKQGTQWKPATGPASGGERVLAASIPLFAAASSHYRTAGNPLAPRLIMLDEAFAGVDDNARASCLGLLAAFDLDVIMTSEREWGCYAEVPGLSIAQLSRFDDTPAVHVQLWSWDGSTRSRVEAPESLGDPDAMW